MTIGKIMKAAPRPYACLVLLLFTACETVPEKSRGAGFARRKNKEKK
jgi:hypothetical protein